MGKQKTEDPIAKELKWLRGSIPNDFPDFVRVILDADEKFREHYAFDKVPGRDTILMEKKWADRFMKFLPPQYNIAYRSVPEAHFIEYLFESAFKRRSSDERQKAVAEGREPSAPKRANASKNQFSVNTLDKGLASQMTKARDEVKEIIKKKQTKARITRGLLTEIAAENDLRSANLSTVEFRDYFRNAIVLGMILPLADKIEPPPGSNWDREKTKKRFERFVRQNLLQEEEETPKEEED